MGNCLSGGQSSNTSSKGQSHVTEASSEYGSSHLGTITGKRYSTVRLENLYQLDGLIGRGQSGMIHLCHNKRTGANFACKSLLKRVMRSEGTTDDTRREVQVLGMLKGHKSVVTMEGVFEDATAVHIVMELCTGGPLADHISAQGEFSERAAAAIMATILEVVRYCHSLGIVHRDVKLSNFLFTDSSDSAALKAIDFGSAAFCEPGQTLTKMAGTALYIAPEVLDESYSFPCDIWSCGVALYILLCGRPPFQGDNVLQVFDAVRSKPVDLETEPWNWMTQEAKDVVTMMLHKDPSKRPTAEELLTNPWIQGRGAADVSLAGIILPRMHNFTKMSKLRHLALLATSKFIPTEQMEEMHTVFNSVDAAGSGELTLEQLRKALRDVGSHMSDKEIDAIFGAADLDGSGAIDYAEFVAATVVISKERHGEAIRKAFQQMDSQGKGAVSFEDFARFCAAQQIGKEGEILGLLEGLAQSKAGDGTEERAIDYNDFLDIVTGEDEQTRAWAVNLL